jgi:hypothetical protein
VGIHAALERKGFDGSPRDGWYPKEKLEFLEALHGYTAAAASAAGVERRRGRLAPGYDADLVAWEVDPAVERNDGEAFLRAQPLLTVVAGAVVMQR